MTPQTIRKTIKVVLLLMIVAVVVIWPLWRVNRFFQPNTRMYFKGCIEATANLDDSVASYEFLEIGRPGGEYAGVPQFELKLGDGAVLSFPNPDIAKIDEISDGETGSEESFSGWYSGIRQVSVPAGFIVMENGRVLQVLLFSSEDERKINIRTQQSKGWRSMPLSDDDLVELFGEPDGLMDEFRW